MANFTPRNWANGYLVQNTDLIDLEQRIATFAAKAGVDVFDAASQSAMLALSTAEKGDFCFRSDTGETYVLTAEPYSTLGNWKVQPVPSSVEKTANLGTPGHAPSQDQIALRPTAIKTSAYTAQPGEMVLVDASAGPVVVTLPPATATSLPVGVRLTAQSGAYDVRIQCAGSDVFDAAGGVTSATLRFAHTAGVWDPKSGVWATRHSTIVASTVALEHFFPSVRPWRTSLGAAITSGTNQLANVGPYGPWTQADVGKLVLWSNNGGTQFDQAKIASVDGSGIATVTKLDGSAFTANFTVTNQRMQFGTDQVAAINAALTVLAADGCHSREAYLCGHFRGVGSFVFPTGVVLRGAGHWGKAYPQLNTMSYMDKTGTCLQPLAGGNTPSSCFAPNAADTAGRRFWGPGGVHGLVVQGPETIVNGYTVSAGSGMSFTDTSGNPVYVQDGSSFHDLQVMLNYDDGIYMPAPVLPGYFRQVRVIANGRYGLNYDMSGVSADNTQDFSLSAFSGDGNGLFLARIANTNSDAVITITDVKSEAGNLMANPRGSSLVADLGYQKDCILFEECDNSNVAVTGLAHIAGSATGKWGATHAPGAAIVYRSTGTKRPKLTYRAVRTRVYATQTDLSAGPATLRDEVSGVTIPLTTTSGHWPPDAVAPDPDLPTDRERNMPVTSATNTGSMTSGAIRGGLWACTQTATRNKISASVSTGHSGTAPTLCKLAVLEENPSTGVLTIIAVTANDTTMFATADTGGANDGIATTAPYTLLAGKRYCIAQLCVTTGTPPQIRGANVGTAAGAVTPRKSMVLTGQTDFGAIGSTITPSSTPFMPFGAAIT